MKIIFSGTGPGLFFMAFGAIVLVVAIAIGGVSIKETTTSPVTPVVQPNSAEPDNQFINLTVKSCAFAVRLCPTLGAWTIETADAIVWLRLLNMANTYNLQGFRNPFHKIGS